MPLPVLIAAIAEALATASMATAPVYLGKNSRFMSPLLMELERDTNVGGGTLYGAKLNGLPNTNRQDFLGDGAATNYDTSIAYAALSNNNWIVKIDKSTRTGTVTVTLGSTTVTGSGTAFTTELRVGQEILVNGERKVIASITSATVLTTDSAFTAAAAGASIFLMDDILMPTTDFTVANNGGYARITLGAAAKAPLNARMSVHFVVPYTLFTYATATTLFAKRELSPGADVAWYVSDATATPGATNLYLSTIGE